MSSASRAVPRRSPSKVVDRHASGQAADSRNLTPGMTDQVILSGTPGAFRTVLVPRGSSKPEWLPL
jgi:hypothetical protein